MNKITVSKYFPYCVFIILLFMPTALAFSNNVWFDEAYTLSLIQHNYSEITENLKFDMHPPLYFISLKAFCDIFGYSIFVTKIFSALGYIATLGLGCTIIKKHFGNCTSVMYMLTVSAVPMLLYFSVQQRSYSWCIFFVTLCFLQGFLFVNNGRIHNCVLFAVAALFAAYNHIYALIAAAVIFAFVNIYIFIKKRHLLLYVILADLIVIIGYLPQLFTLINQTKDASDGFWLTGLEPLSLIVFAIGVVLSVLILLKKENRNFFFIFAVTSILGVQVIGLGISVLLRPLYIARYSVVVSGIISILLAVIFSRFSAKGKKIACLILCVLSIASFAGIFQFEYDPSINNFNKKFGAIVTQEDTFVYSDSSFGIMSYYYPENKHYCTYYKLWFDAFENVEYIDKDDVQTIASDNSRLWFVINTQKELPKWVSEYFEPKRYDSFKSDFNTFDVYSLSKHY